MKTSLKQILLNYIKENGSLNLAELEHICHEYHYKQSCSERRLRELVESGQIKRTLKRGFIAFWELNSDKYQQEPETTLKTPNFASESLSGKDIYEVKELLEKQRQLRFINGNR